jgi:hypothetical protein
MAQGVRTKPRDHFCDGGDRSCDHDVGRSSDSGERFGCAGPSYGSDLPTSVSACVLRLEG